MVYLGVDLGGTGIKVGAVTEAGEILAKGSTPTLRERPYQEIIADIAALCKKVVAQAALTLDDVAAIGVGVPGICDPHTGVIPFCTNLGWHEVPFVAELQKHIDKPVIVDNDATVAGLAESIAGVSAGRFQRLPDAGHGRGRRDHHQWQALFRRAWRGQRAGSYDYPHGRRSLQLRQRRLL